MSRLPKGPGGKRQAPWIGALIKFALSVSLGFTFGWATTNYVTNQRTVQNFADTLYVEIPSDTLVFREVRWDTLQWEETRWDTVFVVREQVLPVYERIREVVYDTVEVGGLPQEPIPAWVWGKDPRRPGAFHP